MLDLLGTDKLMPPDPGSVTQGVGRAGVLNFCIFAGAAAGIVILIGIPVIALFGVLQFAWIIPIYSRCKERGESETAKGILIAAGITFLLSAGCWGMILSR